MIADAVKSNQKLHHLYYTYIIIVLIKMGTTLDGCRNCTSAQLHSSSTQLNEISPYYTSRLTEFQDLLHNIPQYSNVTHSRLVNDLRMRREKFEDLLHPYYNLLRTAGKCEWKRVGEVFPKQQFSKASGVYQFQYLKKRDIKLGYTHNLSKALQQLKKYPQLINKMFANTEISEQGFYAVYFCLAGCIQKRVEIIIDDYIPVDHHGKYIFEEPRSGDGIWMILLEKAWAKIMISYHHLESIQVDYFFSEMTGVPMKQLYTKGDFLMSGKYDFDSHQSKYLKIYKESPISLIICLWRPSNIDFITDLQPVQFVVQVIVEQVTAQSKQYLLLPVSVEMFGNKLVVLPSKDKDVMGMNGSGNKNGYGGGERMLELPKGQTIIHIFNKSKAKRDCNIIIHSKTTVNTHTRYEKQFKEAKMAMVRNEYKKYHNKNSVLLEYPELQLRFCWIGHRGIFYIKNKSADRKNIDMCIKKSFIHEIIFEDSKETEKSLILNPKQYGFFVVIRSQDREYGHFYQFLSRKA